MTTWYSKIFLRVGISLKRLFKVVCPNLLKASSVGAKRVNGPATTKSSVRLAAFKAVNSVWKCPSAVRTLIISSAPDVLVGVAVIVVDGVVVPEPDWELALKASKALNIILIALDWLDCIPETAGPEEGTLSNAALTIGIANGVWSLLTSCTAKKCKPGATFGQV